MMKQNNPADAVPFLYPSVNSGSARPGVKTTDGTKGLSGGKKGLESRALSCGTAGIERKTAKVAHLKKFSIFVP
ncbi:MAG: hypothetical protein LBJ01_03445 [Tannerella sp.]|jgi:hypothetical protein|nr:hypothetical protein [Tannerella sp.]